jgi:NADH-quinone oxidoreductase subunit L
LYISQTLLLFLVLAPGVVFSVLSLLWLLGWTPGERQVSRITKLVFSACILGLVPIAVNLLSTGADRVVFLSGDWFRVGEYQFPLVLVADRFSLPFLAMTLVLSGLVGQFSVTYMHRERGFLRFFLLLHLFAFGSLLAFAAGSFDLVAAGWEIVGITSVLLIAFFQQRAAPVENGLRVFLVYRASDVGLLVGVVALHNWAGTASFFNGLPALTQTQATIVSLLFLLAAAGKAAQIPFSGWLPRAMEGPTPSSAIFYGAISIHAGAFLLLRIQPLLSASLSASALVIIIGLLTAIHGTIVGRASADAKTSVAYASLTQVGVVFVEIGAGWTGIAVAHILGHATVRTLQFLRTPSMLHDYHEMHSASGGELAPTGRHLEQLFPDRVQLWLYRWALDRSHLDTILDRYVVEPLRWLSGIFSRLDGIAFGQIGRGRDESTLSLQTGAGRGVD